MSFVEKEDGGHMHVFIICSDQQTLKKKTKGTIFCSALTAIGNTLLFYSHC